MTYNIIKHMKTLELDKVLSRVSEFAVCDDAGNLIKNIIPETSFLSAKNELDKTDEAYRLTALNSAPPFSNCKNIENALSRAKVGSVLQPAELLNIASVLKTVREVKKWYDNSELKPDNSVLKESFDQLYPNKYLEEKITFTVISEEEISDNASAALSNIRNKIKQNSSKIRESLDKTIKGANSKYLQEAIITQREGRYVVPVKAEFRNAVSGIVHDTSSSGSTVFIEPIGVVEANNQIRILKSQEKAEIERILKEISLEVSDFSDNISFSFDKLVELDVCFAKSKYAYFLNCVKPELNNENIIVLNNARHPLIDKNTAVPISIEIGKDFDTLVITGPNTGGKTVSLKTVGLLSLMAACGLFIPALENSKVAVFEKVFADIGDEQSISQSLSTFSSHMKNIVNILEECGNSSLVLLDELCSGTDPVEGAALAKAILLKLSDLGAKTVSTTHYSELKTYALDTPRVQNAGCEFDINTLKPTYKLVLGTPGRSNAFLISKRLGLSDEIIDSAKTQVNNESGKFERVIANLEEERQKTQMLLKETENLKAQLKEEKNKISAEKEKLDLQISELTENARKTAAQIIENAKYKSSQLLNDLEEKNKKINSENAGNLFDKAKKEYHAAMKEFDEISDPITRNTKGEKLKSAPNIGDKVLISSINSEGEVLDIDLKGKRAYILSGSIKLWVKYDDLLFKKATVNPKKQKSHNSSSHGFSSQNIIVSPQIDLRGLMADEAMLELDKYIDNAKLAGLGEVTIIHGKGTGVLRNSVKQFLKSNKHIESFRLGVFGEGKNGVTVATLKK